MKYFDHAAMAQKAGTRSEPFDLVRQGWTADYADGGNFLETLLYGKNIGATDNLNLSYFDDPDTNAKIEAAGRLTGEARRKAWADLDIDLMRTDPPGRRSTTRPTAPSSRRASAASSSTRSTWSTSPPPARSRGPSGWETRRTERSRGCISGKMEDRVGRAAR